MLADAAMMDVAEMVSNTLAMPSFCSLVAIRITFFVLAENQMLRYKPLLI